jgi:hypothetical protein
MREKLFKLSMLTAAGLLAVGCETLKIGGPTEPTGVSPVEGVTITPRLAEAAVGHSAQFAAVVSLRGGGTSKAVTWNSTDPIAAVDSAGVARCVAAGVAAIYATAIADPAKMDASSLVCTAAEPAPQLLNVTPGSVDVDVDRNATNVHVCTFRIQALAGAVTTTYKSDHPALVPAVSSGTIPAGGVVMVSVFFKGPQSVPFTAKLRFTASTAQGTQEVEVPVKIGFR